MEENKEQIENIEEEIKDALDEDISDIANQMMEER